ncbi:response regulator [Altericroceibacterium xinjiangense]|uniref:response regulator n=1 Tax=Altericroceibacterium xinjiangense TaxID=762261 RepID=UPI000F7EB358|nr:response regulator [Altericroceibacterium xinjiangense]
MVGKKTSKTTEHGTLGRILVVEDDPILSLAIEAALMDRGAREVVICPSIECTMGELERGPADAIVLDVHLTDRNDGWALAELVDQLGPKRPRIAFSTGSPEDIPPEIAEMGPVFAKPYDLAELAEALVGPSRPGFLARLRDAMS